MILNQVNNDKIDKFLEEDFDKTIWSFSRINSFYTCPYTWYITYIEKSYTDNFHSYVGSTFHNIMEDYYKFKLAGGKLTRTEVIKVMKKKWDKEIDKNPYFFFHAKSVYKNVRGSFDHLIINDDITDVERKYLFDYEGYQFQGMIDADEGDLWHLDYKSRWKEEMYINQQNMYMYAKHQNTGNRPKGFHIVQYKENLKVEAVKYDRVGVYESMDWAIKGIKDIRVALENRDFPTKEDNFFCKQLCIQKDFCRFAQ